MSIWGIRGTIIFTLILLLGGQILATGQDSSQHAASTAFDPSEDVEEHEKIKALRDEAQQLEEKGDARKQYATKSAIKFYLNAEAIYKGLKEDESVLRLRDKLASAYYDLEEYDNALKYQYEVLMHYKDLGDTMKLAQCHSAISDLYAAKNDFENALKHGQLALEKAISCRSKRGIAALSNNLAGIYQHIDSLDKAFELVDQAVAINTEMGNTHWLGINYTLYADLYGELKIRDSIAHYLFKALDIFRHTGNAGDSISIFRKLGIHYHDIGKPQKALEYFNKGIRVSEHIGSLKSEANLNHWISEVYQNMGQMDLAMAHLQIYYDLSDSLSRRQNRDEVEALRILYEVSELEDSLTISHANEQLAQKELRNKKTQLYSVSGALLLLLGLGTVIAFQWRRQARSNAHLLKMNLESVKKAEEKNATEKYASSSLSDDKRDEILAGLKKLMEEQQLYTDPQLKLETVADQLGVSRTYLSQIINQAIGENFSSYINALRVRLAKEYLIREDHQKYSIQGIAEIVGFNSLSAFNAAFKKETGLTPSYFRKNSRPGSH